MKCEHDNEIALKALNLLHRAILLGDAANQESYIENLVQLVRYFAQKNSRSSLGEELENLERAVSFLLAGGELKLCQFPDKEKIRWSGSVERFAEFDTCFAALNQGVREGKASFAIQYDSEKAGLSVKVMND